MTLEEAIKHLTAWIYTDFDNMPKQVLEALNVALSALRPVNRERVEKVWRGEWVPEMNCLSVVSYHTCSKCGEIAETLETGDEQLSDFCPFCGAPMTDEAVQMVMERLNGIK